MMRKTIITMVLAAIAMIASVSAHAESNWGPTVGLNYNEIHFKQTDIFASDKMVGGQLGVTGELMMPGVGFGFDASLLYSMQNGKLHLGDKKVWSTQGVGTETAMLHYINVPINLKFRYHNLNGIENTIQPEVFVGPTIEFLAAHSKVEDQLTYNRVTASLHFGLGAYILNHIEVKAGYQFALGDQLRTKLLDEHYAKNRTFFVNVTYYLK